ncbi:hypothetical protein [Bizionia paragorgiae]|uniref:hypothetical protein n=1 Tax=Bizionia paragorgiae TaxID=283786 RepID=UPI003A8D7FCD
METEKELKQSILATYRIHSKAEMLEFIEAFNFEVEDLKTLLREAYGIYITGQETKQEIINGLKIYFKEYGTNKEMPLFLN